MTFAPRTPIPSAGPALTLDDAPPLRGGESAVYLAGPWVVKVALAPLPFGAWLEAERDRLAELGADPATAELVPRLVGEGTWDGRPFLVLERFETSLDRALAAADPAARFALAIRAAEVVARLHEARPGLVHRDLKPSNFLLGDGRLVLTDFGCARERPSRATTTRALFTPGYAPPEQALPHRVADPTWDVFGLAATVFHALTGHPPEAPVANGWKLTARGVAARDGRDDGRAEAWAYLDLGAMVALTPADRARLRAAVAGPARVALIAALAPDPRRRRGTARDLVRALRASRRPVAVPRAAAPVVAIGALAAVGLAWVVAQSPAPAGAYRAVPIPAAGDVPVVLLGEREVTQALWRAVTGEGLETRRRIDAAELGGTCARDGSLSLVGDALPMVCVSFRDAVRFANALSARDGLAPAYTIAEDRDRGTFDVRWAPDAPGWRLPTAAEWRRAAGEAPADRCRDNVSDRAHGRIFPGRLAVPCDDGLAGPGDVGALPPGPWGLRGITGNVDEWLWDGDARREVAVGNWDLAPAESATLATEPAETWLRKPTLGLRLARRP